ncbi:hypothetical protein [Streptomyces sp. STR69]|uniref:hypothetical protein n=1 Tax=Streptomyces sp. STR69 TaxID=1796942 RepID=UPI0021C6A277|nr:hypothetical protein [Streptomyces sp. STR69]
MIDESLLLAFRTYAARSTVDAGLLLDADISLQHTVFDRLLFEMRTKVLVDELPPEQVVARQRVTYEVPASTWQMWKKRHASSWYARRLVARWPVQYEPDPDGQGVDAVCTLDLERFRAYPRAKVRLPRDQFGPEVLSHVLRGPNWRIGGDGDA